MKTEPEASTDATPLAVRLTILVAAFVLSCLIFANLVRTDIPGVVPERDGRTAAWTSDLAIPASVPGTALHAVSVP